MSMERWVGPGIERIDQRALAMTAEEVSRRRTQVEDSRDSKPAWAIAAAMALDHAFVEAQGNEYIVRTTQAGWPLPAFQGAHMEQRSPGPLQPNVVIEGAFQVAGNPIRNLLSAQLRLLPFRPMSLGLIVNTLLYGIALWLFFATPAAFIRWRRRRRVGLCATCGYDLRGKAHDRCPECGTDVGATKGAPLAS
jgi:hypothetical protein